MLELWPHAGPRACPGLRGGSLHLHPIETRSCIRLLHGCWARNCSAARTQSGSEAAIRGSFLSARQWLRSVTVLEVTELFQNPFRDVASVPHCFFDFPLMHPLEEPQPACAKGRGDRHLVSTFELHMSTRRGLKTRSDALSLFHQRQRFFSRCCCVCQPCGRGGILASTPYIGQKP